MTSRRELIEAEDFRRRRAVAALLRGDPQEIDDVPKRPNAALLCGIIVVLVIAAAVGGQAALSGRAPDGWHNDHTLVIDKKTGARFLVDHGLLRPAPTVTSALLAGGHEKPVDVPHDDVASAGHGPPLAGARYPEQPLTPLSAGSGPTACVTGKTKVAVYGRAPAVVPARASGGVLARAPGSGKTYLVAGRKKYLLAGSKVLAALDYSAADVRTVPATWLALVPRGTTLNVLRPATNSRGSIPGLGHAGQVVEARDSGQRFLIQDGTLRPIANHTSELLAPSLAKIVADPAGHGAPIGKPYGYTAVPASPPTVPGAIRKVTPCVRSSDGNVVVAAAVHASGMRPAAPRTVGAESEGAGRARVRWFFPPSTGALLAPPGFHARRRPGEHGPPATLVDGGAGYRLGGQQALRALGYHRKQVVEVPRPWLDLLAHGPALKTPNDSGAG